MCESHLTASFGENEVVGIWQAANVFMGMQVLKQSLQLEPTKLLQFLKSSCMSKAPVFWCKFICHSVIWLILTQYLSQHLFQVVNSHFVHAFTR